MRSRPGCRAHRAVGSNDSAANDGDEATDFVENPSTQTSQQVDDPLRQRFLFEAENLENAGAPAGDSAPGR